MSEYEQGIVAQGNDYATDVLHIDLSDYAKNNGPHKVDLQDGTQGTTSCPTGTLNVVASSAQVVVTLPNGCWWAFGSNGNFYNITDFVGSSDGLTLDSGNIYVSLMGNDSTKSVVKSVRWELTILTIGVAAHTETNPASRISMMRPIRKMARIPAPIPLGPIPLQGRGCGQGLPRNLRQSSILAVLHRDGKAPVMPAGLRINTMATIGGSVAVQYASDNTLGKAGKE